LAAGVLAVDLALDQLAERRSDRLGFGERAEIGPDLVWDRDARHAAGRRRGRRAGRAGAGALATAATSALKVPRSKGVEV
jgi:hypothetical protein